MRASHFTDPACPFAFSAEPQRQQLRWHYGDQLEIVDYMVVLSEQTDEMRAKGFDTAKLAKGFQSLQGKYGMPINISERKRLAISVDACRAFVAARLNAPERAEALLRALRVRTMGGVDGGLLDDPALIAGAARDAGIDPNELAEWTAAAATEDALRADMAAARDPHPAARVLDHKLGDWSGGRRYTCPSYVFEHGGNSVALPGFQPWESYDAAIANLHPEITRRPAPEGVSEILAWADEPLATAEIAALLGTSTSKAREQLEAADARFDGIGEDGYWTAE